MRALLAFLAALLFCASALAQAQIDPEALRAYQQWQGEEHILSFVSDVDIARNGDLDVTETIRVVSRAQNIRHGIQRDFPTRYTGRLGQPVQVGFQILSVERDGQAEPYERSSLSNGTRVRIGRADTLLPPGEHIFIIRYRTTRQMIYGADSDELYWNVTGTGWTFPIDRAEARVRLPTLVPFGKRAFFTGPQGAAGQDAAVVEERPGLTCSARPGRFPLRMASPSLPPSPRAFWTHPIQHAGWDGGCRIGDHWRRRCSA